MEITRLDEEATGFSDRICVYGVILCGCVCVGPMNGGTTNLDDNNEYLEMIISI